MTRRVCRMAGVEIGSFEVGKLGDPESRVKKGPDKEFLFVRLQAFAKRVGSSEE